MFVTRQTWQVMMITSPKQWIVCSSIRYNFPTTTHSVNGFSWITLSNLSYQGWTGPAWWMAHVAVVGLSMMRLVSMVVVAVLRVVALRTGPVPLTQRWRHPLLAWDVVGLHEGHARQHRLAAQQPSLAKQTTCQRSIKRGNSGQGVWGERAGLNSGSNREMHWHHGCDFGDEETSTDPFHMVSNRVVGMVCHRRGLNACVFGGNRGGGFTQD